MLRVPRPVHEKRDSAKAEAFKRTFLGILKKLPVSGDKPVKIWFADESRYGLLPNLRRGRGDRIASPSSCFPGGTPFLKTLRQTCLLAGSYLCCPSTKKPFSQARRVFIWSGRQDCFAFSLRSSNPRCGYRRIATTWLLSNPVAQRQKNPPRKRDGFHLVGATGFEPATLCSQSRCASQAAPRPVSKRRRQTITK